MTTMAERRLVELVDRFLSGADRSMALVNEIEGLLIEHFGDTDLFEELTEPLALYRPGEGAQYVGEEEMAGLLRDALRRLHVD
jgi:hypothetical protein